MTLRRKSLYAVAALLVAATLFSIASKVGLSSHPATQLPLDSLATTVREPRARIANGSPIATAPAPAGLKAEVAGNLTQAFASNGPLRSAYDKSPDVPDSKIIRNAALTMVVKDVRDSASQLTRMVMASHGQIDNLSLAETAEGCFSATIVLRIPATGLEDAVTRFKSIAVRTEQEQITARDVTHEFYDSEAHLRNLRAEEQQYLAIMKQSGKIPDTLEVAEHLSDVRDRIERQQAAVQAMSHDVEMSQVSITLTKLIDTKIAGFEWRPLQNARAAMREELVGLSEWADLAVAFLIRLPLAMLWVCTFAVVLWILFIVCRWIWRRFRHLLPAFESTSGAKG
jgi:hypothetical protein